MSKSLQKNITLQDIAISARISASTVSRSLNNHPKISQKTKEKVWKIAKKLGYLPNIPVYMQKQESNIVVFLVDDVSSLANHEFIEVAQESLLQKGFQPIIKFVATKKLNNSFIDFIKDIETIGVINLLNNQQLSTDFKLPLITINKSNSGSPQVHILPDIYNGAYLAANHLLNQGAKNIILIVGDSESLLFNDMQEGFKSAFTSNKESSFKILKSNLNKEVLKYEFEQLITEKKPFDGVITCNNYVACQLHTYLNSKNIKIPDNVMLVSFGNEAFINLISPGISTIEYSSENMGSIAAEQLAEIILNKTKENKILIEPTKLIIRASSLRVI